MTHSTKTRRRSLKSSSEEQVMFHSRICSYRMRFTPEVDNPCDQDDLVTEENLPPKMVANFHSADPDTEGWSLDKDKRRIIQRSKQNNGGLESRIRQISRSIYFIGNKTSEGQLRPNQYSTSNS